jgi:hypothetical protein
LVEVPPLAGTHPWYEVRLGGLVILKLRNWEEAPDHPSWELHWPGPDAYRVNHPPFSDPQVAFRWFFDHFILKPKEQDAP